jgi:hypothetical protein
MAALDDIKAQITKLGAWQYLNAATFIGVCIIIGLLVF